MLNAIAECGRVESDLDFARALRAEVRVADVEREERGLSAPSRAGGVFPRADGVERARCATRLSPRRAELHLGNRLRPERFVRRDPRRAHLRIRLKAEVLAERAVAVDAKSSREEVLIADVEQDLSKTAGIHDALARLEAERRARAGHDRDCRGRGSFRRTPTSRGGRSSRPGRPTRSWRACS